MLLRTDSSSLHVAPGLAPRELVGTVVGWTWAPAIAAIARLRRARMFHPDGLVCSGRFEPLGDDAFDRLGARLAGPVLARFSGALWRKGFQALDVLGIALRFTESDAVTPGAADGDQDLLFATIVSPFTMPFAPFTTNARDYLANRYWAVAPFDAAAHGPRVKLRLVPEPAGSDTGDTREARLREAIAHGHAKLRLDARAVRTAEWQPLGHVVVRQPIRGFDQDALRFSPFRNGRGLRPRGLVHALRHGAYVASQLARPA